MTTQQWIDLMTEKTIENEKLRAVNKQMLEALKLIYENKYEGDKLFIYCGRQVKDAIKAGEEI